MQLTDYFSQICQHCGITDAKTSVFEDDAKIEITIQVSEEDAGLLIGHHGETIQALQKLARASFGQSNDPKRVFVNVNDYRQLREEKLRNILITTAQTALETQSTTPFPMHLSSSERYYVHTTLAELPEFVELESVSVGEGVARRLIIQPKATTES